MERERRLACFSMRRLADTFIKAIHFFQRIMGKVSNSLIGGVGKVPVRKEHPTPQGQ